MNKVMLIAFAAIALSGCIEGPDQENMYCDAVHEYSTDQYGDNGIVLLAGTNMRVDFNKMQELYKEMEKCVGVPATPGPTIWYTDMDHLGLGHPYGATLYGTQHVLINTNEEFLVRNCISDKQVLKHEFVHHLLYMNGQDPKHGNPAFEKCALGVKTCNGVPCE